MSQVSKEKCGLIFKGIILFSSFLILVGCQAKLGDTHQVVAAVTLSWRDLSSISSALLQNSDTTEEFKISEIEVIVFQSNGKKVFEDKLKLSGRKLGEATFRITVTSGETYKFQANAYNRSGKKIMQGETTQKITESVNTVFINLVFVPSNLRIELVKTKEFAEYYEITYSKVKLSQNQNTDIEGDLRSDEMTVVKELTPGVWKAILDLSMKDKISNEEKKLRFEKYFVLTPSAEDCLKFIVSVAIVPEVVQENSIDSDVVFVDIAPDNSFLITASKDKNWRGKLTKWRRVNSSSGSVMYEIEKEIKTEYLQCARILPDSQWIIASESSWIVIYSSDSLEEIKRVNIPSKTFELFYDGCKHFICVADGYSVSLYTFPEFNQLWKYTFSGDNRIIRDIRVLPIKGLVLVLRNNPMSYHDGIITVHSLYNGGILTEYQLELMATSSLAVSKNEKWLTGGTFNDNSCPLIDLESWNVEKRIPSFSPCPVFSNANKFLILPYRNKLFIFNISNRKLVEIPVSVSFVPRCSAINLDDNLIALGGDSKPNFVLLKLERIVLIK